MQDPLKAVINQCGRYFGDKFSSDLHTYEKEAAGLAMTGRSLLSEGFDPSGIDDDALGRTREAAWKRIIPVYDRVNRYMTLGTDKKKRKYKKSRK